MGSNEKDAKPKSGSKIPSPNTIFKLTGKIKVGLPKKIGSRLKSLNPFFLGKKDAKEPVTETESQKLEPNDAKKPVTETEPKEGGGHNTARERSQEAPQVESLKNVYVIDWYNTPHLPGNPSSYDDRLTKAIEMRMIFLDDLPADQQKITIASEKREAENIIARKMDAIDTEAKRKYYSQYSPKVQKNIEYGLKKLRLPLTLADLEVLENILEGNEIKGDRNPPLTWLENNNLLEKDESGKYTIAAPSDNNTFIMNMLTLAVLNTYDQEISNKYKTPNLQDTKDERLQDLKVYIQQKEMQSNSKALLRNVSRNMLDFLCNKQTDTISFMMREGTSQMDQVKTVGRSNRHRADRSKNGNNIQRKAKKVKAREQKEETRRQGATYIFGRYLKL